jgi:hypothetical protein
MVGRWAQSAKKEKLGDVDYYQWHVKAEFFADGVGWVPADLSSAVLHDKKPDGLTFFGNDPGDFLVQHLDESLEVDSIHFGRQPILYLQIPVYWVTGQGTLDNTKRTEGWVVKKK